ncbi:hypothetical protein AVEN_70134-1 [Araneus ventricosus]|uniref:Uncharacterized protein n=1 Tax=Araneus ventricosus TaxID=182803 RepID=A0A4Y2EK55_ARAVE|nr:hypothetical protein AVEN_70134-1 [Araneus ventricosus]
MNPPWNLVLNSRSSYLEVETAMRPLLKRGRVGLAVRSRLRRHSASVSKPDSTAVCGGLVHVKSDLVQTRSCWCGADAWRWRY